MSVASSILMGQVKDTTFSFNLEKASRTSAGIFKNDGTLMRTLWGGVEYSAGKHEFKWDGKDDFGLTLPDEKYIAKVLSNNVAYQWEGVVGNTSTALTGSTKLRLFDPLAGMAIVGNNIYWAAGYNEGWPSTYKTSIVDPNSKTWVGPMKQTNAVVDYVCTDGLYVYWSGVDPFDDEYETFVFATNVSNDERVAFTEGVSAAMGWGGTYKNAIGYKRTSKSTPSIISGIAVQAIGIYLFISRKGQNEIQVLNKTTGKIVQTLTMNQPAAMKVDYNDNLWLAYNGTVEKFMVTSGGKLASTGIVINLPKANAIAVSPDNKTVSISDIASGKVKSYAVTTGEFLWELGKSQNYMDDATVYDDKFYWKDINKEYHTFLSYMPDGTFYVGDPQNRRVQHFTANRTYLDHIMYQSCMYNAELDPNDPTRLYADYFEFKIDYSKPLGRVNDSWKLVKNWGANVESKYDQFEKMKNITTFPNGKTYGRLRIENRYYVTELVQGGTVRVNPNFLPQFTSVDKDGSKMVKTYPELGKAGYSYKYPLIGYDGNNNPNWSNTPEVLATTPPLTNLDPFGVAVNQITSTDKVIFYDPNKSENGHGEGYHLGAIQKGSNKWLWRTAMNIPKQYVGPFPLDGAFDSGNGVIYAGGPILISDQNIFWGYHGEFWKQSQTNKWNHVHDSGLFVGQWGTLGIEHNGEEAVAETAGNTLSGSVVKVNGITYIYHNDESAHGGVHRWKINNLSTIQIQDAVPTAIEEITEGIDLLAGLVRGESLKNGVFGWSRDIAEDYANNGESYKAIIGQKSYDKFKSPDLYIVQSRKSGNSDVTRTLGTNSDLTSWKLWGKVNYDTHSPNEPTGKGGGYMDILDQNNLVIARFYINRNAVSGTDIIANGKILYNSDKMDIFVLLSRYQDLEISAIAGNITIKYASYYVTTGLQDNKADWKSPSKLRFNFFTNNPADDHTRSISVFELRFLKKKTVEAIPITPKKSQTITFVNTPTTVYENYPVTLSAIATSGLSVSYKVLSGPGSITGNVLSFSGYGTLAVQALQTGDNNYLPATSDISIVNHPKNSQTITFLNTLTTVYSDTPVVLSAVSSSGLAVTYEVLTGPGSITGNVLNFTGNGTVTIQALQAGNESLSPATATISITHNSKTSQTLSFGDTPTLVYANTPVTLAAFASSGLAVTYKILSGLGAITGNILTFTGYGAVNVQATQAGTIQIASVTSSLFITNNAKIQQTVVFTNSDKVSGRANLTLTAIASSGLPISFQLLSGAGSISGDVLTLKGNSAVTVQAVQEGNNMYEKASATQRIERSKASQTVMFTNTSGIVYGITPVTLAPIASSGLPVSLEVLTGDGYIEDDILNFNGYGTVTVRAVQAGNDLIAAASATAVLISKPKPNIQVYPNPVVSDNFTIRLNGVVPTGNYTVQVLTIYGQVLYEGNLNYKGDSEAFRIKIDQSFDPGIYVLQILGTKFSYKLLKR